MELLPRIEPTRQEALLIWLRRRGLQQRDIARRLGIGQNTVSRWLAADTIPSWRHRQLVSLGIPAELLPAPLDIAPGPKRGRRLAAIALPATQQG